MSSGIQGTRLLRPFKCETRWGEPERFASHWCPKMRMWLDARLSGSNTAEPLGNQNGNKPRVSSSLLLLGAGSEMVLLRTSFGLFPAKLVVCKVLDGRATLLASAPRAISAPAAAWRVLLAHERNNINSFGAAGYPAGIDVGDQRAQTNPARGGRWFHSPGTVTSIAAGGV